MLKYKLDKRAAERIHEDPYGSFIIKQCERCGLWYSVDLGHECGTVEKKPAFGEWIVPEEVLPQKFETVLAWVLSGRIADYALGWRTDGGWFFPGWGCGTRCIAWMPLPKPYEEDES